MLVEFTSDIGAGGSYTIELKTTPTEKNAAQGGGVSTGVVDRQGAMKVMVGAILRAGARGGPVAPGEYGEYKIEIEKPNHRIELAGRPSQLGETASESVTFANQASVGVATRNLGAAEEDLQDVHPEVALILEGAKWFDRDLDAELATQGLRNPDSAKAVYALVASAINKLQSVVTSADFRDLVKVEGDEITGDLYNSKIKDSWDVLPRTPVWDWIKPLHQDDQGPVRQALKDKYDKAPTKAAFKHIANGLDLAGHPIPTSTIGGAQASVFEFRGVPNALIPYLYSSDGREWEISQQLSEQEQQQVQLLIQNKPQSVLAKQLAKFVEKAQQHHADQDEGSSDADEWAT